MKDRQLRGAVAVEYLVVSGAAFILLVCVLIVLNAMQRGGDRLASDAVSAIPTNDSPPAREPAHGPVTEVREHQTPNISAPSPAAPSAQTSGSPAWVAGRSDPKAFSFNGADSSAIIAGNSLRLVDGGSGECRSIWWNQKVDITRFVTDFSFQVSGDKDADGFSFCVQNEGLNAKGVSGSCLGYLTEEGTEAAIGKSVAIMFDIFTSGSKGSKVGLYVNGKGSRVDVGDGVDFHAGNVIDVHVTYDGSTVSVRLSDTTNPSKTSTLSYPDVNIAQAVEGTKAYVGFTASTGGQTSIIDVTAWAYREGR